MPKLVHEVIYGCMTCPYDKEGYLSFETRSPSELYAHLEEQHGIAQEQVKTLRGGLTLALDMAGGAYSNHYEYKLDGKSIISKLSQGFVPKKGKKNA